MPFKIDGISAQMLYGIGLVLDAKRGIVVVERNTVAASIGDINLTFATSIIVPGKLLYMHPLRNFSCT